MQIPLDIHSGIRTQAHSPNWFSELSDHNPLIRVPTCLAGCGLAFDNIDHILRHEMTEPRGYSLYAEFPALSRNVTSKLNFQNSGITITGLFFLLFFHKQMNRPEIN